MYKWSDTVKEIIEGVLLAPNPVRYLARYVDDPSARGITFLLFDGDQETNFRGISHEFCANKYHIVNLGCYERTVVLSTAILSEKREELPLKVEYLINLDSNMASFLPGLLKSGPIDSGFLEFLRYVKQNHLNLDLLPYLLEDSLNSTGMRNHARAYECLLAFFAFDRRAAQEIGDLPYRPDTDDYCCADNAWAQMRHTRFYRRGEDRRVRGIYCFLLAVYRIQFQSSRSPRNKLAELVTFLNERLGVYYEFGVLLAYWYFNRSHECVSQFFQKVQPKSKNKLKDIEGMAWDLFHLWDMPTEMAVLSEEHRAVVLQGLATRDDALAKIAKLNPITRIAFYGQEAQVKYAHSIYDELAGDPSVEALARMRSARERLCADVDLLRLTETLERELLGIF